MDAHIKFRVILDHIVKEVSFPEMPSNLQQLIKGVQETFAITEDISLQYKDTEFNDFFTLTSTDDLKDKDTLKIIYVEPPTFVLSSVDLSPTANCSLAEITSDGSSQRSSSVESDDTVILPQDFSMPDDTGILPPTMLMHQPWPREFPLPRFSYTTEIALEQGMVEFEKDGTLLWHNKGYPHLKANILECLAEAMFKYTAYSNDTQRFTVAEALIKKYPCLKEPGSFNGLYGWQQSLKYKVGNYRTTLRAHGVPEVVINSLKQKSSDKPAKGIKKAKKCEVNYLPPVPTGETPDSLEIIRVQLLSEAKKKNNEQVINSLMSQTFSLRRQEVLAEGSNVVTLLERWPALFEASQICQEFQRLTALSLEPTFFRELDKHTGKMLSLFNSKGGAVGQKIKPIIMELLQNPSSTIEKKRDNVLRCLIAYMGENQTDIICDQQTSGETEDLASYSLMIFVFEDTYGIVIDGQLIFKGLATLANAFCLLIGLIYGLDLEYPTKMKHTFEVLQRLFMGLNSLRPKPSNKYSGFFKQLS